MPSLPTGTVTSPYPPGRDSKERARDDAAGQQHPCQPGISRKCSHEYSYVFA